MKKQIQITAILIGLCYSLTGQNFTEGIPIEYAFSTGKSPVLQVRFDKVSKDNIKEASKEVFKKHDAKLSAVKNADYEFIVSEFRLEENQKVSYGKLKILETNGNSNLYAFFKTNESEMSDKLTPNDIVFYKNLVKDIAKKAVVNEYQMHINKQEKKLKDENKTLKNLLKDEEGEHKNIGKYKNTITNSEHEIEQLKIALSNQELSITKNNDLLKAKESEIAGKSVKSLNSDISEIKKENKSLHKTIVKHKEKIAKIKGKIAILNSILKGNDTEKLNLKASENIDKKVRKRLKKLNKAGLKTLGEVEENKILIINEENNIVKLEDEIKTGQSKIDLLQAEIAEHNEDALKDQLSLLEKESKRLTSEKRSYEKKLKKANEKVNDNNEKIRLSEDKIKNLKATQEEQKNKIEVSKKKLKQTQNAKNKFK